MTPIPTSPELLILILSTGVAEPSGVVLNTKRPGISLVPGVPSTFALIRAASINAVPSEP